MCMHTQQTLNKHTCIIHKTHLHVLAITDIKRTRMQTQKDVHMYKYAVCIIHKHAYTKKSQVILNAHTLHAFTHT